MLEKETFYRWLEERHYFACCIYQSARLLHGAFEQVPAITHEHHPPPPHYPTTSLKNAAAFLVGAENLISRGNYSIAAFMLHQAVEQSLDTLL